MSHIDIGIESKPTNQQKEEARRKLSLVFVDFNLGISKTGKPQRISWERGGDKYAKAILKAYLSGVSMTELTRITKLNRFVITTGLPTLGVSFNTPLLNKRCRQMALEIQELQWEINRAKEQ